MHYGAEIERGIVIEEANGKYRVSSYSRPGVISPEIESTEENVHLGDKVYFFLFPDGDGKIIAKM